MFNKFKKALEWYATASAMVYSEDIFRNKKSL